MSQELSPPPAETNEDTAFAPAAQALLAEVRACTLCPLPHGHRPVFQLHPEARVLIAGQAPGTRVHATGLPFNDPSGDRLRGWLGVDRESFYDPRLFAILPMGLCFPGLNEKGADLPPRKECAPQWRAALLALLPRLQLILTIGQYAQAWHLGRARGRSVSQTVARWRDFLEHEPAILPMPHPSWRNSAWLKRHPWFEAEVVPILQQRIRSFSEGV